MTEKKKKVGYGCPPKETQFKPGISGNQKGRPKGSKNMYTLLTELLNQKILVNQNGKPLKISKKTAMLLQLVNKGAKGDLRAIQTILPHVLESDVKEEEHNKVMEKLSKNDQEILKNYLKRRKENE